MITIGKRHPLFAKYKVSVDKKTGKIEGLEMEMFIDCGYGCDFSPFVLFIAQTHVWNLFIFFEAWKFKFNFQLESCYFIENFYVHGKLVRTNLPNNTAYLSTLFCL